MKPLRVDLTAVIVALEDVAGRMEARILSAPETADAQGLPAVAFDPATHKTLERGLRDWVTRQTGLTLGYAEQLYTFADGMRPAEDAAHPVSIGYLALMRPQPLPGLAVLDWRDFFPWEDRRDGVPELLSTRIAPGLADWAGAEAIRRDRADLSFGLNGAPWRDELVLERYELLYEAGLVEEAQRDRGEPPSPGGLGLTLPRDQRRILATGLGRLRAKLKYRPVIFQLMPELFTLGALQSAAEAVTGVPLHKQNFRRMILRSGLIEETGTTIQRPHGRPAAAFRIASDATWEARVAPVRFGGARRGE